MGVCEKGTKDPGRVMTDVRLRSVDGQKDIKESSPT